MKPDWTGVTFSILVGIVQTAAVVWKIFYGFPTTWLMTLSPILLVVTYFVTSFIAFLMWQIMFGDSEPPESKP